LQLTHLHLLRVDMLMIHRHGVVWLAVTLAACNIRVFMPFDPLAQELDI